MQHRGQQDTGALKSKGADKPRTPKAKNDDLLDMIGESIRVLTEKLARPCAPSELQAETESLSSMLETLSLRAEFIARLLDNRTSAHLRDSLRSSVAAMHIEPQLARQEMLSMSNDLIKKGSSLIAMAQERINKEAHRATGYALKICGLCRDDSGRPDDSCVVCKGRGSLVVREPATECRLCEGKGKANGAYANAALYPNLCAECNGMGWITAPGE
jgi:hypothetical protein